MKKFVCESLQSFLQLNEDRKIAEDIFAKNDISTNDPLYIKFFDLLKNDEDYMGKFAEWLEEVKFDTLEFAFDTEKELEEPLNRKIESFKSFDEYLLAIKEKKKEIKDKKIVPEEPKKTDSAPEIPLQTLEKEEEKDKKTGENQVYKNLKKGNPPLLGYRLWLYAVYAVFDGIPYVKFGETYKEHEKEAIEYALKQTLGKFSGLLKKENLIFCEDVTEFARKKSERYVYKKGQQFDDLVRKKMAEYTHSSFGSKVGLYGKRSDELHEHKPSEKYEDIKKLWIDALYKLVNEKEAPKSDPYVAREFHEEMNEKLSNKKTEKYLLGTATGSGKEVITLSSLIYIHDQKNNLFDENTIHVSCATIPSTELELFEELSKVPGIKMKGKFIDFSRIKAYCTRSFADGYKNELSEKARDWFENGNVKVVDQIKDIRTHPDKNEVPVLFGSFPDIGLKESNGDPTNRYEDLKNRIGILAIGEGHQFLSNPNNKLWSSLRERYNFKFFLLITGTPYDFIFNEGGSLYFSPNERTLFTRTDLYQAKKEGVKDFQKFPDFKYYSIDLKDAINKIKEENEDFIDAEGFKYEKFFEVDKTTKEFKYKDAIIYFFRRLLSFDEKGKKDTLSIDNAPGLCEAAKRHIIVALPIGSGGISAGEYIPKLDKLLEDNGATGIYNSLEAYDEEDLGEIKRIIDEDKTPTMTLTCRKMLTGTNIPQWGSLIFLRPIGNSVKFFEQATGRIGRAYMPDPENEKNEKNKINVGVFLGDMDNIVNIHISADEKLYSGKEGEIPPTNYFIKRAYDNYNFFGVKNGKWQKINEPELIEAMERASMRADYGINLCLNNPKVPEDFNEKIKNPIKSSEEKVELNNQGNQGAKIQKTEEKTTQGVLFDMNEAEREKWYTNLIKTHIPKIVTICLLKDFSTIQDFEKAFNENKEEFLEMMGEGGEFIPLYIGDDDQIDRRFINRWIDKNNRLTSDKTGFEGFQKRYDVINNKMDIRKLSESIIFDPIKLTDEICEKIKDPLKEAKNILVIEKNGSFTYSILKEIGFENANKLTLILLESLSQEIIHYLFKENEKLPQIKFIKDINEIKNMPKFDVIVGNPPYQGKKIGGGVGSGNAIWQKFVELSFEILKEDGYLCFIHPVAWRYFSEIGKGKYKNVLDLLYSKQILYLKVFQTPFPGIGTVVDWYVAQNKEKYKETTIKFLNGTYDVFIESPPILNYGGDIVESIRKKVLKTEDNGFFSRKSFGGLREFDTSKPKGNYKLAHGARYLKNEWKYSEYPHIHQNHPKVIMSAVRQPRPIFDPGEIGISDHVHYILVENKEQGDFLISIFKSKLMKFLQKLYASDVLMNDDWPARWYNTTPFTKIKIDDKKLKNDKEVYQYFNLSPEEIKYIESEIK